MLDAIAPAPGEIPLPPSDLLYQVSRNPDQEHFLASARGMRAAMLNTVLAAGLVVASMYSFWFLWIGLANPTLDSFAFRQSQTAISAYWIARGGPWLAYQTPVFGAPWSLPFEFPTYQLLVALVSKTGLSLEVSGRLVSYVFYVATLVPARYLFKRMFLKTEFFLIFAILYLVCPLYIFWGRSVMIETAAVFFSMYWLTLIVCVLRQPRFLTLTACVICGSLAVLTKSTTFLIFGFAGAIAATVYLFEVLHTHPRNKIVLAFIATAIGALVPLAVGSYWVVFSDVVKEQNALAAWLTASQLKQWNFGTLQQRLSSGFWIDVVWKRMLTDVFGYSAVIAIAVFGVTVMEAKRFGLAALGVIVFLVSLLTFTNLNFVHSYYQVSNAIFLIFAVATAIAYVAEVHKPVLATVLLMLIVVGQVAYTSQYYLPMLRHDAKGTEYLALGKIIQDNTGPDDAIVVIGNDWSSEIPYYAQRRALTANTTMQETELVNAIQNPHAYFADFKLGAVVDCRVFNGSQNLFPAVNALLLDKPVISDDGKCRILKP